MRNKETGEKTDDESFLSNVQVAVKTQYDMNDDDASENMKGKLGKFFTKFTSTIEQLKDGWDGVDLEQAEQVSSDY